MNSNHTLAYDDHGARILTVDPEYPDDAAPAPADSADMLTPVLAMLIDDSPAEVLGQRLLALGYLAGSPGAPTSQRQLARRLGISLGAVNAIFQEVREEMGRIGRERLKRHGDF